MENGDTFVVTIFLVLVCHGIISNYTLSFKKIEISIKIN